MPGPASSYSSFLIHMPWNVDSEARMEPPIQTLYFPVGVVELAVGLGRLGVHDWWTMLATSLFLCLPLHPVQ